MPRMQGLHGLEYYITENTTGIGH